MDGICSACKTGANTIEDEPFSCPFVNNLKDGKCKVFIGIDLGSRADITVYNKIPINSERGGNSE